MNNGLTLQLALRYLRGKRGGNAVPILSRISMVAIGVGSCAMIILLSVFNGFEFLLSDLYKAFYPEIRITAARGKFFAPQQGFYNALKSTGEIAAVSHVLEDNVLIKSDDDYRVATLKGIDKQYFTVNTIKPYIVEGRDTLTGGEQPTSIFGYQLLISLGLDVENVFSYVMLYYPNPEANMALNPQSAFQSLRLRADGAFRVQDDFDDKYMLASLPVVQQFFNSPGRYSSIELKLKNGADADNVKSALANALGKDYVVETRFEQNRTLYMVMRSEKWAVYAILLLVLLIASFNMVGALSFLVLEKQKDMAILKAMGASASAIRNIFIAEGLLWSMLGGGIGIILGLIICLGQQYFHFITLPGSYVIDAFPVHLKLLDLPLVIATIIGVGLLASWYPAVRATKIEVPTLKST